MSSKSSIHFRFRLGFPGFRVSSFGDFVCDCFVVRFGGIWGGRMRGWIELLRDDFARFW